MLFVIGWILYRRIASQQDALFQWQALRSAFGNPLLWLVVAMMPFNWGLEAWKWKLLLGKVQVVKFSIALKAVFAGCSITMLTPNRVGEYGGRVLYADPEHRIAAIGLTVLGSAAQLIMTLLNGFIALTYLLFASPIKHKFFDLYTLDAAYVLWAGSFAGLLLFALIYFAEGKLAIYLHRLPYSNKFGELIASLRSFGGRELLRLLGASFLRYLVFALQFYLMLKLCHVKMDLFTGLMLISLFYLLMAVAPTVGFTELPVRALAGTSVFGLVSKNFIGIQAASLGIWLTNVILPAVIGAILITGIKMKERS